MGTLLAFMVVSLGILPLRKRADVRQDGYKMPGYPVLPILSSVVHVFLITQLHLETLVSASVVCIGNYFVLNVRHETFTNELVDLFHVKQQNDLGLTTRGQTEPHELENPTHGVLYVLKEIQLEAVEMYLRAFRPVKYVKFRNKRVRNPWNMG